MVQLWVSLGWSTEHTQPPQQLWYKEWSCLKPLLALPLYAAPPMFTVAVRATCKACPDLPAPLQEVFSQPLSACSLSAENSHLC